MTLKKVYILPNASWNAQLVSRYAVAYQPMSFAELNSSVICGMAVEMIMRSRDTKNMPMKMDVINSASLRPVG